MNQTPKGDVRIFQNKNGDNELIRREEQYIRGHPSTTKNAMND